MKQPKSIIMEVHFSWWLTWLYLPCIIFTYKVAVMINIDAEINHNRVSYWVNKGISFKVRDKNSQVLNGLENEN